MPNTHAFPDTLYELQMICGDLLSPGIVTATWPAAPGTGMTLPAFATRGYVIDALAQRLVYVAQPDYAVVLSGSDGTYWVGLHLDTSSAVAGWTRVMGSHYLWAFGATRPPDPGGGVVAFSCTVSGGNITAVQGAAAGSTHNRIAYFGPGGHLSHHPKLLYVDSTQQMLIGVETLSASISLDIAGVTRSWQFQVDDRDGNDVLGFYTSVTDTGAAGTGTNRYAFLSLGDAPSLLSGTLHVAGHVGIGVHPDSALHLFVAGNAAALSWRVNDYSGSNFAAFLTDLNEEGGTERYAVRTLGLAPSRFAGPVQFDSVLDGLWFHINDHPQNFPAFSSNMDKDTASGGNTDRYAFAGYGDAPSLMGGTLAVLGSLSQGTTPQTGYGFYQAGGNAFFGASVGIGVAPSQALDVLLNAHIRQHLQVSGSLGASGPADGNFALRAYQPCYFQSPVGMGTTPSASYALVVNNAAHVLNFLGVATPPDPAFALIVGQNTHLAGSLNVIGTAAFQAGMTTTNANVANSLSVGADATVNSNLRVAGVAAIGTLVNPSYSLVTAGSIWSSANVQVTGALSVGGITTLGGTLSVTGGIYAVAGMTTAGSVGIKTDVPAHDLSVQGTAGKTGGGVWENFTSARQLKQAIAPLTGALATLLRLQGRTWRWADDQPQLEAILPGPQVGFVLDEVEGAMGSRWVMTTPGGTKSYAERGFPAYVVEAFRELHQRLMAAETALQRR